MLRFARLAAAPGLPAVLALGTLAGCIDAPGWADFPPPSASTTDADPSTSSPSDEHDWTTHGGIMTSTPISTSASSSGEPDTSSTDSATDTTGHEEALPVEVKVFLSPSSVDKVGEVQVAVWTSRPVQTIDVFDGDAPLVLGAAPGDPVCVFEVTSENVPGDGTHTNRAVAHAADGAGGQAEKDITIDVAPGGTDVWPPYVQAGPVNGFTGAALLDDGSIAAGGFRETPQGIEAVVVKLDGATGTLTSGPVMLGTITLAAAGRGPAIAADDDGAVYVASTRPPWPAWAVSKVRLGEPVPLAWVKTGDMKTKAHAIAVAGDVVIVVGAFEAWPDKHDLKVWWLAAADGALLHEQTFRASVGEDLGNERDEIGRGVALVGDEVVVVGEREIKGNGNKVYRRTVVLRYSLAGEVLAVWTSPGELLEEDGGMAVTPLHGGGFAVVGWGRNKDTHRQLLTRWFSAAGEAGPVRIEPTPGSDAIGYAIGEDREGKLILAGSRKQPATDADAWVFAIPGPLGPRAWEIVRNGPGNGPDDAAGLAVGPWGHVHVAGSEFADLQPRAFVLRLYP